MEHTKNILITGATGFVGSYLVPVLLRNKYQVTVVGRDIKKMHRVFEQMVRCVTWDELDQLNPDNFFAVINLAGENISAHRWTASVKQKIINSRIQATSKIVNWCLLAKHKKPHLYNTSAVGIYGVQPLNVLLTENAVISYDQSVDFLSEVAKAWEDTARSRVADNFPMTFMRFAVVLKRHEGMLKKLDLSFSLGLGAVLGNGQQAISWIHVDDLVRAILFLLLHPEITGPVNMSAPTAVSQRVFAETLADVMHRPLFLKMPSAVVTLLFGEMGKELLLGGQNAVPERLVSAGFQFLYPDVHSALAHEWYGTS
jgi:uncharacterized protein